MFSKQTQVLFTITHLQVISKNNYPVPWSRGLRHHTKGWGAGSIQGGEEITS